MQKYMLCTSSLAIMLVGTCLPVAIMATLRHGLSHWASNLKRALVAKLDSTIIGPERFEWATQLKAA
jgi:hypothetical protein